MHTTMRLTLVLFLFSFSCATSWADSDFLPLLDRELSRFDVFIGVPHNSVEGLPEGTYQSGNVHDGTPMGLGNDIKNVFSVAEIDGETILKVSGEIYGGLTSKERFSNYHLRFKFRWGDRKWPPRLDQKRDSGLLYHCHGEHGAFWKVWKSCLELQIQESDFGDFIPLPPHTGPSALVRVNQREENFQFDPASTRCERCRDYTHASAEPDKALGEWNEIELYTVGDTAIHVVNGEVVMVVEQAQDAAGKPLAKGQIQIQSEAAECSYKEMEIRSINDFPEAIKRQAGLGGISSTDSPKEHPPFRVLVFTKTNGFRHDSIPDGVAAIQRLGETYGFEVVHTEVAEYFTPEKLESFRVVVFLSTSGNVLDTAQEEAFQNFMRAGGGYVGIHAACDTEHDWPWYGRLVGAYFSDHPQQQTAELLVMDSNSSTSTSMLPRKWTRWDEWYNFRGNPSSENVHFLLRVDESSYEGGAMGAMHPMSWQHEYDGGRSWFTALGHTKESFSERLFLMHILGGIKYAAGLSTSQPTEQ